MHGHQLRKKGKRGPANWLFGADDGKTKLFSKSFIHGLLSRPEIQEKEVWSELQGPTPEGT